MKSAEIATCLATFLPAELRRARRQVRGAAGKNPDEPVHEARKSIKKLRAALRLAVDMAPERKLVAVGDALRDAAHALGPMRDHLVLNETGGNLVKRGEKAPPEPKRPAVAPLLKTANSKLRRAAGNLSRLLHAGFDHDAGESGLRRLYKSAAAAMTKARQSESDEDLHAWRRRAKDLLYALELIEAPAQFVKRLDKLTRHLGDDHDLATFIAHHNSTAGKDEHSRLLSRAEKQRGPLQKKAFRLGGKIFDASARRFARRMLG